MSLRKEQSQFSRDIVLLLTWASVEGYEYTFGEAQRTAEQQAIYVKAGRSQTFNSRHLRRLAMDIFFFKEGRYLSRKEEVQPIGNKWESLSAANQWGGNWDSFKDVPHFERRV
jgi:hypothetical protein